MAKIDRSTKKGLALAEMTERLKQRKPLEAEIDSARLVREERERRSAHLVSLVKKSIEGHR